MKISQEKLKELLVKPGHVSEEDFEEALKEGAVVKKEVDALLIAKGLIQDEQLGTLIADYLQVPFINLRKENIDEKVLYLIPEQVARSKKIVAFVKNEEEIKLAMEDPHDLETIHLIEKRTGGNVIPFFATRQDIEEALSRYKSGLKEEFDHLILQFTHPSLLEEEKDKTMVKMVDLLFEYGYYNRASDIHIEPYTDRGMIRFRIDGVLHDMLELPKELLDPLLSRIKILAKMRTDEHRAGQEGKMQFDAKEELVDVRVSVVPVPEGENVVMRLLAAKSRELSLGTIGLGEKDLEKIKLILKKPHGMTLATGPTGCGKTTTIYGILKVLDTREVHIATIEDPIEYAIEGVTQIQVNPKMNLTFAQGLRAIIRQDPNIIMVGEIRDEETASIAINAAMTGHLVLSTMHASNAATTLTRLLDMGVEPFLVASTINMIIAQRLVRKICEKCRVSYPVSTEEKYAINAQQYVKEIFSKVKASLEVVRFYKGMGCKTCSGTGLFGRIGIFEVLEVTDKIQGLVTKRATSGEIMKLAMHEGMTTLFEDGFEKALNGVTTLQEVLRLIQE